MNVKIIQKPDEMETIAAHPLYKAHRILSEGVVAVFQRVPVVNLDRLYATGMTILEVSKDHMFRSFYDFIQPSLGGPKNVQVILTDTDSLLLSVKNLSRKEMMDRLSPVMDFSNYNTSHPRYSTHLKSRPGLFKDESCGSYITEVIGLKSKCYAMKVHNVDKESIVCKGIARSTIRTGLTLDMYRSCIEDVIQIRATVNCIRSQDHQLTTQSIKKIALTSFDDKRFISSCARHTLAYGSVFIPQEDEDFCPKCVS